MSTDADCKSAVSKYAGRWIDKRELFNRYPISSDSARQRWEGQPDPRLRLPKGTKFTPGGSLFWREDEVAAWEERVRQHRLAQQFDPDELPGLGWLPETRATLEAEIKRLREELEAARAELSRAHEELEGMRGENKALIARNVELCRELTPPREAEEVEAEQAR
jgi:hypothetical protein